jgi:hypothetical protein
MEKLCAIVPISIPVPLVPFAYYDAKSKKMESFTLSSGLEHKLLVECYSRDLRIRSLCLIRRTSLALALNRAD